MENGDNKSGHITINCIAPRNISLNQFEMLEINQSVIHSIARN